MADYYPLIARAIGGLPDKSGEARKAVYERARRALLAQLRAVDPPLSEPDIQREQQALEDSIARVEADYPAAGQPSAPAPVAPPAPASPPPAAPPAPVVPPAPAAPRPAERPTAPPVAPERGDADTLSEAEAVAAGIDPSHAAGERHDWRSDAARMVREREAGTLPYEETDETGTGTEDDAAGEPVDEEKPSRGGRGRLIAILVFVVLLIAGAFVGYTQRETIVALIGGGASAPTQTAQAPTSPARTDAPKSTDRIAQAPDTSRPAQPEPGDAPAAGQGIDVAQRAALFEESAGGGEQGLQQYVGTVVWSTETINPGNGLAPDVGIRADITIPARNISATLTLRRNQDSTIPASHIIEAQFRLPPNFDLGNVSSVPGMRAKASEGAQGAPLVGLAVRVAPNFFLIGLSALDSDIQRNLGFLVTRNWLDLPLVFENGRRAILVLEKGPAGDQVFRQAFSAWGLPVAAPNGGN